MVLEVCVCVCVSSHRIGGGVVNSQFSVEIGRAFKPLPYRGGRGADNADNVSHLDLNEAASSRHIELEILMKKSNN